MPGYGAQGAGARDTVTGFVNGPKGLEGGVINASRSVTAPEGAKDAASAKDWERAVAHAIEAAQAELTEAVRV